MFLLQSGTRRLPYCDAHRPSLTVMAITDQPNIDLQRSSAIMSAAMAIVNKRAGQHMCEVREKLGLTMRDVHRLSKQIARSLRNRDYIVSPSRLSDIEAKGHTPNLYRLHAMSLVYNCRVEKLLNFYSIADGRDGTRRSGR
jgi:hypothetical protein